jgi:hypothetical protein
MEILHGTGVIGYGRGPRLVARDLRVAFGLWVVGCRLWVVGYGFRAWVMGYGFGAWVMSCGLWVTGLGRGLWVTDMGMGIGCACIRVAFRFGVRLFHFHILIVMNSRWISA